MKIPSGMHNSFLEKAFSLVMEKDRRDVVFPVFIRSEKEDIAELKKEIPALSVNFNDLVSSSSYTYKKKLIEDLRRILQRLRGELDAFYDPLADDEKEKIKVKLCEVVACLEGLHDRAQEVILSFDKPKNFDALLQLAREDLVQRLGVSLLGEVHAANTVTCIASDNGYGVRPRNKDDKYFGSLYSSDIQSALKNAFSEKYTPYHLPFLLSEFLRAQLASVYAGPKKAGFPTEEETATAEASGIEAENNLHNIYGFDVGDLKKITGIIEKYLPVSTFGKSGIDNNYFVIADAEDGIRSYHKDINWQYIYKQIFEKIKRDYCSTTIPLIPTNIEELAFAFSFGETIADEVVASVMTNFKIDLSNNLALLAIQYRRNPTGFQDVFKHSEFINATKVIEWKKLPICLADCISLETFLKIYFPQNSSIDSAFRELNILLENFTSNLEPICFLLHILLKENSIAVIHNISETVKEGPDKGVSGFYWLMRSLDNAAYKNNSKAVKTIVAVITAVIEKTDTQVLASGLSEKRTQGDWAGANGFSLFTKILKKKNNFADLWVALLIKLNDVAVPVDVFLTVVKVKGEFIDSLKKYLQSMDSIAQINRITDPKTLLGKCIDYHRHYDSTFFFGVNKKTKMREFVDELVASKKQISLLSLSSPTLKSPF